MESKQPSYQRPTKASLARARVFLQPEMKITQEQIVRKQVTKERLDLADRVRQGVPLNEQWPGICTARLYRRRSQFQKRKAATNGSTPTTPRSPAFTKVSSASLEDRSLPMTPRRSSRTESSSTLEVKFPFSIRRSKDLLYFPQFSLLPVELRLLIWRWATFVPKFIELNYCLHEQIRPGYRREYKNNNNNNNVAKFINYQRYDLLSAVCLESREVSQQFSPNLKNFPCLTITGRPRRRAIPNPKPVFVPERDTVFLRPIDPPFQDVLSRLPAPCGRGFDSIQHIAIPLDMKDRISGPRFWPYGFNGFRNLKTLTLMLGCAEKTHQ